MLGEEVLSQPDHPARKTQGNCRGICETTTELHGPLFESHLLRHFPNSTAVVRNDCSWAIAHVSKRVSMTSLDDGSSEQLRNKSKPLANLVGAGGVAISSWPMGQLLRETALHRSAVVSFSAISAPAERRVPSDPSRWLTTSPVDLEAYRGSRQVASAYRLRRRLASTRCHE